MPEWKAGECRFCGEYNPHLTFVIGGVQKTSSEVFCAWICPKCFNAIKAMQRERRTDNENHY